MKKANVIIKATCAKIAQVQIKQLVGISDRFKKKETSESVVVSFYAITTQKK